MKRANRAVSVVVCAATLFAAPILANGAEIGVTNGPTKLAFLIPNLYGPSGLTLPNPDHEAHFDSSFQTNFGPFNTAIGSQLGALPLPSSASGFTYTFDPTLGVYNRSTDSFGPILAERSETLGKDKFYAGFAYQHFKFSSLDGVELRNVPAVFQHAQTTPDPIIRRDIITTDNFLDVQIGQFTTFFTYGLMDHLDVSVALPVVSARLDVISGATIRRIGTLDDNSIHYFLDENGNRSDHKQFSSSGSASGIGDVLLRLKQSVVHRRRAGVAFGFDVRMATGDEYDFLGTGTTGLRPFVAMSFKAGKVSPHLNLGYQWNGNSVLAGDVRTGTKGHLPNQFTYAAGFDAGISKTFTFAFDILGQGLFNAQTLTRVPFVAANGQLFPQISFHQDSRQIVNGSAGFKVSPVSTLLISANFVAQMNDSGLRARVVPLVGISYAF